jgi:uncharacterized protein (TIGR01777 family)
VRIVVGGANGLIGRQLVSALQQRGDQVTALVRRKQEIPGATVVEWDGRGEGPWRGAIDGADAVVNLAGAGVADHRWTPDFKRAILESRTQSTGAIVAAIGAAARKPRVLVNASAVGYYGGRGEETLDESASPGVDFLAGVCKAWEDEARKADIRTVLLRTGVVLTRQGGALGKMLPPFKAFVGGPIGDGRQWMPWIHIDDEVAAILWAIDREDVKGPLNLVAPAPVPMSEFARTLGQVLHRPSWAPVPAAALKLLLGEIAEVLVEGQRAVPAALRKSGFVFRFSQLREALEDLFGDHRRSSAAAASSAPSASRTSTS